MHEEVVPKVHICGFTKVVNIVWVRYSERCCRGTVERDYEQF